ESESFEESGISQSSLTIIRHLTAIKDEINDINEKNPMDASILKLCKKVILYKTVVFSKTILNDLHLGVNVEKVLMHLQIRGIIQHGKFLQNSKSSLDSYIKKLPISHNVVEEEIFSKRLSTFEITLEEYMNTVNIIALSPKLKCYLSNLGKNVLQSPPYDALNIEILENAIHTRNEQENEFLKQNEENEKDRNESVASQRQSTNQESSTVSRKRKSKSTVSDEETLPIKRVRKPSAKGEGFANDKSKKK
ncbi:unnamed protein product, partial [Didymodactylos carnosus]